MRRKDGFTIVYEARKDKQEAVIQIECTCPVCGVKNGVRVHECHPRPNRCRNYYTCPQCGTEWLGNTYTSGWEPVKRFKIFG